MLSITTNMMQSHKKNILVWLFLLWTFLKESICEVRAVVNHDDDFDDNKSRDGAKMFNFASQTAGAVVLDKSPPTAKGYSNLLNDDKDKYGISPCSENKWIVIGLSEDVLITSVAIANYERYSSMLKEFRLYAANSYPSDQWINLGSYIAEARLGEQLFNVTNHSSAHTRYLKIKFKSHYESDALCTLSQIKVHGMTVIASFKQEVEWSDSERRDMLHQLSNEVVEEQSVSSGESEQSHKLTNETFVNDTEAVHYLDNSTLTNSVSILSSADGVSESLTSDDTSLIVPHEEEEEGCAGDDHSTSNITVVAIEVDLVVRDTLEQVLSSKSPPTTIAAATVADSTLIDESVSNITALIDDNSSHTANEIASEESSTDHVHIIPSAESASQVTRDAASEDSDSVVVPEDTLPNAADCTSHTTALNDTANENIAANVLVVSATSTTAISTAVAVPMNDSVLIVNNNTASPGMETGLDSLVRGLLYPATKEFIHNLLYRGNNGTTATATATVTGRAGNKSAVNSEREREDKEKEEVSTDVVDDKTAFNSQQSTTDEEVKMEEVDTPSFLSNAEESLSVSESSPDNGVLTGDDVSEESTASAASSLTPSDFVTQDPSVTDVVLSVVEVSVVSDLLIADNISSVGLEIVAISAGTGPIQLNVSLVGAKTGDGLNMSDPHMVDVIGSVTDTLPITDSVSLTDVINATEAPPVTLSVDSTVSPLVDIISTTTGPSLANITHSGENVFVDFTTGNGTAHVIGADDRLSNTTSATVAVGLASTANSLLQNSTSSLPPSVLLSCFESLRLPEFQAKMTAKLNKSNNMAEDNTLLGSNNNNVFRLLMGRIKALELENAIMDMYVLQLTECYRVVTKDLQRGLAAVDRREEERVTSLELSTLVTPSQDASHNRSDRHSTSDSDRTLSLRGLCTLWLQHFSDCLLHREGHENVDAVWEASDQYLQTHLVETVAAIGLLCILSLMLSLVLLCVVICKSNGRKASTTPL